MIIDDHAYWDAGHMSLDELQRQILSHGLTGVILSPPCTQVYEPDKSAFMYAVQRILLRNDVLRPMAELVSRSFYNGNGHLRPFWRLFTKNAQPIHKVIVPDNKGLLAAIAPFDNLYAWCWVNPRFMPPGEQIKSEISHPQVVGLKLHAYWHGFGVPEARPIFALAAEIGLPVYLLLGFGWVPSAIDLLGEFPSVNVIFGYGGFPYFDKLWKLIKPSKNAHVDFASLHIDQSGISTAIRALGPERCLYGSDCPYNFKDEKAHFDYSKSIERITRLALGSEALDLILRRNAERLLFGENLRGRVRSDRREYPGSPE